MVRDGRCVTARMHYFDPPTDTFLGLPLTHDTVTAEEDFVAGLREQGIEAVIQYDGIALPEHFMTIDLGDHVCWWDPQYWGREGFVESAVAL